MKTDEELLEEAAENVTQILRIPHQHIDKKKFVYLYTLLYNQLGRDDELMRHWMNTYNSHLGFFPAARLTDEASFDKMIGYLESFER
jgi:hypothetical protein